MAAHVVLVDIAINDRLKHPWILSIDDEHGVGDEGAVKAAHARSAIHEGGSGGCMTVEGCQLMDALLTMCNYETGIVYFETFPMSFRYATITTPAQYVKARENGYLGHPEDGSIVSAIPAGGWGKEFELWPLPEQKNVFAESWVSENFHPADWPLNIASGWHWPRLLERKLPVISYGDGSAKAAILSGVANMSLLWSKYPHPDLESHMFCALTVLYGLTDLLTSDPTGPSPLEMEWDARLAEVDLPRPSFMTMCHVEMVSQIGAENPLRFSAAQAGAAWKFYEDVRGKPGWIVKAFVPSTGRTENERFVGFNVTLGPRHRVIVTYLRTYGDGLGTAVCSIGNRPDLERPTFNVTIKTKWDQHASQAAVATIKLPSTAEYKPGTNTTVWCMSQSDGKVKLLGIGTC